MRYGAIAVLSVFAMLAIVAVPFIDSDSSDATVTDMTIKGLLLEPKANGNVAVVDAVVTLSTEGDTPSEAKYTLKASDNGVFTIVLSVEHTGTDYEDIYVEIEKSGYTVRSLPGSITKDSTGTMILNIDSTSGTEFIITASNDKEHAITIMNTSVTTTVTVTGTDGIALQNANVTLTGATKFVGWTDYRGIASFTSVPIGPYDIMISCNGYETYTEKDVEISTTENRISKDLVEKEPATYFGLSLYHMFMVFGVSLGMMLVVVAYILVSRTWKGVAD